MIKFARRLLVHGSTTRIAQELEFKLNWRTLHRGADDAPMPETAPDYYGSLPARSPDAEPSYLLPTIHGWAGMGHRVSSWISAYIVSQRLGLVLLHLPWRDSWDSYLGLDHAPRWHAGMGPVRLMPLARDERYPDDWRRQFHFVEEVARKGPAVFRLGLDQRTFDQSPAFDAVRAGYWRAHTRAPRQTGTLQVSVHVRRGDVHQGMSDRFRPVDYFVNQLKLVTQELQQRQLPFNVTIHSQDDLSDVGWPAEVEQDLSADQFQTFDAMARADVLIASPSSYSVTAGMVSEGVVLRPANWFHALPREPRWVGVTPQGTADRQALHAALQATLSTTRP